VGPSKFEPDARGAPVLSTPAREECTQKDSGSDVAEGSGEVAALADAELETLALWETETELETEGEREGLALVVSEI
jgi:hypothetical protein